MTYSNGCAVLWDLDGTIIDSRAAHWAAWRAYTDGLGKPVSRSFFDETFGFRNEIILRLHFGDHLTGAQVERMSQEKETLYREMTLRGKLETLPGVVEWLAAFRAANWRQALGSMAPRENIGVTLAALGIEDYFEAIVAAEDVRHGKPDPEVFLAAAERLNVAPNRCIVIEDSPQGVEAAFRAGMKRVAVGPEAGGLGADLALLTLADGHPRLAMALIEQAQTKGRES